MKKAWVLLIAAATLLSPGCGGARKKAPQGEVQYPTEAPPLHEQHLDVDGVDLGSICTHKRTG